MAVGKRNAAGSKGRVSQKHSHEADNIGSEAHFNLGYRICVVRASLTLITSLEHI